MRTLNKTTVFAGILSLLLAFAVPKAAARGDDAFSVADTAFPWRHDSSSGKILSAASVNFQYHH